jgi:hypothetical protein
MISAIGSRLNSWSVPDIGATVGSFLCWVSMKPSVECRKLAEVLREKAKTVDDAELRAEYQYLVRGFLRLASQFEQDMNAKKASNQRSRKAAA